MYTVETNYRLGLPRTQVGMSLVELMIALTIGLILLLGITSLIVMQNQTSSELEKSSRQIENGRYASQILHDDIQHAGFYGIYQPITPVIPATLPDPCDSTTAGLSAAMALPIQGYNSPTASPIACLLGNNYKAGTDILVIRRASTVQENGNISVATPPDIYLQTTPASYVLAAATTAFNTNTTPLPAPFTLTMDTGANTTTLPPAPIREYVVRIYFISPCSVPANGSATCTGAADDNGHPIPTLKRLEITGANAPIPPALPTPVPLVEGIENMQLDYGLDTDGDGYPDTYTTAPANTTDWSNVMAVRVNLLARNNDPSVGYADSKTYNLGLEGAVGPFNAAPYALSSACGGTASYPQLCNYKRHAYTLLVRAVNPSGRRAQE